MREVELHSFLRKHGGLEGLARELGQSVPPDPEAPPAAHSRPTLQGTLVVAGALLIAVAAFAYAVLE